MFGMRIAIAELRDGKDRFTLTASPEGLDLILAGMEFIEPITVEVASRKFGLEVSLRLRVRTTIRMVCARCTKEFDCPFDSEIELFVKAQKGGNSFSDFMDEDFAWLDRDRGVIELAERIREEIILELPQFPLCDDNCGGIEYQNKTEKPIDDKWQVLKKLKNKI